MTHKLVEGEKIRIYISYFILYFQANFSNGLRQIDSQIDSQLLSLFNKKNCGPDGAVSFKKDDS